MILTRRTLTMSNGIKLSPKHGVNPCIPVCFFCGEDKNEIAMLGKIGKRGEDLEAPRRAILDFTPCEECQKKFAQGVLLIEVTNSPEYIGMPIAENAYPTGRYVVVKPEALNGDFKAGSKALVHRKDFIAMIGE
jgi:hypothetical protein